MESKKIKEIRFGLENMESVIVPYECFKDLSINKKTNLNVLKEGNIVYTMACDITDNGKIEYGYSFDNEVYPLIRLSKLNDICYVDVVYEDLTKIELKVDWGNESCCYGNNNINQTINKVNYNAIHIDIIPFVQTYTIQEVFEFHVGGVIKDEDGNCYMIEKFKNTKRFKNETLTQKLINMKYRVVA